MNAVDVLWYLAARGVRLRLGAQGKFLVEADPGALTSEARATIDRHRSALYRVLSMSHPSVPVRFLPLTAWQADALAAPREIDVVSFRLRIPLHAGPLQKAVDSLARRNPQLKVIFRDVEGTPVAAELRSVRVPVSFVPDGPEREVAVADNIFFELDAGPLWAVTAVNHPGGRSSLSLAMHHVIAGGLDLGRMTQEILCFHERKHAHPPPPPPEDVAGSGRRANPATLCRCGGPHETVRSGPVGVVRGPCPLGRGELYGRAAEQGLTVEEFLAQLLRRTVAETCPEAGLNAMAAAGVLPPAPAREKSRAPRGCPGDRRYQVEFMGGDGLSTLGHTAGLIHRIDVPPRTGCFEIRLTVYFQPDGSGTCHFVYSRAAHRPKSIENLRDAMDRALVRPTTSIPGPEKG